MTHFRFHRHALFAALLALGLAAGADAQTSDRRALRRRHHRCTARGGLDWHGQGRGDGQHARGRREGSTTKSADMQIPAAERRFLEKAARDGMAEVQLGQLAQQRAQDTQVKDFGRRMVNDHGKANDQLKSLASTKGVTLPADLDSSHKRLADRLGKASGRTSTACT